MTVEEKLKHFYDATVGECSADAEKSIEEYKSNIHSEFEKHKQTSIALAEEEVKAETKNARVEINKALSSEQLTLKKEVSLLQNKYKNELFSEVRAKLDQFIQSSEYEDFLCEKIKEAKAFADKDEISIYISCSDQKLLSALSKKSGTELLLSETSFIGGIKAMIPDKNILIDNSFLSALDALEKEFKFDGGSCHE